MKLTYETMTPEFNPSWADIVSAEWERTEITPGYFTYETDDPRFAYGLLTIQFATLAAEAAGEWTAGVIEKARFDGEEGEAEWHWPMGTPEEIAQAAAEIDAAYAAFTGKPRWEAIAAAEWEFVAGAGTLSHYISKDFDGTLYVNFENPYTAEAFSMQGKVRNWGPVLTWAVYQEADNGKLHNFENPGK